MGWSCQRKHTSGPSLTKTSCGLLLTSLFHAETVILTLCSHILDFCDTLIADVMTSWMSIPPASKHGTWIQAGISMRIYNLVSYHVIIEIDWKSLSLELQVRSLKPWPANPKTYFNIFHCIIIGFAANWIKITRLFRNRWSRFEMSVLLPTYLPWVQKYKVTCSGTKDIDVWFNDSRDEWGQHTPWGHHPRWSWNSSSKTDVLAVHITTPLLISKIWYLIFNERENLIFSRMFDMLVEICCMYKEPLQC